MVYLLGVALVGAGLYQHQRAKGDQAGVGLALICGFMALTWPMSVIVGVVLAPMFLLGRLFRR
jgi:hypothetical protein